jgi:hypothetical protein
MEKVVGYSIIGICVFVIEYCLWWLWDMWAPCRWRN